MDAMAVDGAPDTLDPFCALPPTHAVVGDTWSPVPAMDRADRFTIIGWARVEAWQENGQALAVVKYGSQKAARCEINREQLWPIPTQLLPEAQGREATFA